MLAKIKNKDTESVIYALIRQSKKHPDELYKVRLLMAIISI